MSIWRQTGMQAAVFYCLSYAVDENTSAETSTYLGVSSCATTVMHSRYEEAFPLVKADGVLVRFSDQKA
jgi:hypothetical protein